MRSLLRLPLDIVTSFFFVSSIGIASGVVAISFSHRLGDGLRFGVPAFLLAAAGFGYFLYRSYRPERERTPASGVGVVDAIPGKAVGELSDDVAVAA
jgi:hypothetical protein